MKKFRPGLGLVCLCALMGCSARETSVGGTLMVSSGQWVRYYGKGTLASARTQLEGAGAKVLTITPERRFLLYSSNAASIVASLGKDFQVERRVATAAPAAAGPKLMGANRWNASDLDPADRVTSIDPAPLSFARAAAGASALPSSVDNSVSVYFPPIGNQGGEGSCVAWATGYYYATFTRAKSRGDMLAPTRTQTCSPAFLYALGSGGVDQGSVPSSVMQSLDRNGCASIETMPYNGVSDYQDWPSEAAWVDALGARMSGVKYFCGANGGCTDGDLRAIKQHLANGNLATTAFGVYTHFYNNYGSQPDGPGFNNWVVHTLSGGLVAGHAVTLVGYDDERPYADSSGNTRRGAFLLANSWGRWGASNTQGDVGYFWVSYDYFKSVFWGALFNSDRPAYKPRAYALFGYDAPFRYYMNFSFSNDLLSLLTPSLFSVMFWPPRTGQPFNSSHTIAADLTDILAQGGRMNPAISGVMLRGLAKNEYTNGAQAGGDWNRLEYRLDLDNNGHLSRFSDLAGATRSPAAIRNSFTISACDSLESEANQACSGGPQTTPVAIDTRTLSEAQSECRAICRSAPASSCCDLSGGPGAYACRIFGGSASPVPSTGSYAAACSQTGAPTPTPAQPTCGLYLNGQEGDLLGTDFQVGQYGRFTYEGPAGTPKWYGTRDGVTDMNSETGQIDRYGSIYDGPFFPEAAPHTYTRHIKVFDASGNEICDTQGPTGSRLLRVRIVEP